MKLITKKTFNQIFAIYDRDRRIKRKFVRVKFLETASIIRVNLGHLYTSAPEFAEKILKIGFVSRTLDPYAFDLKILPEYAESIKNLFDLAISTNRDNVALAYQIFQNIRQYAIVEVPKPVVEVPKPIEVPPEIVDFSKYQLGNVEYSEEERNNLISKSITKKVKKTHKTQINLFATT